MTGPAATALGPSTPDSAAEPPAGDRGVRSARRSILASLVSDSGDRLHLTAAEITRHTRLTRNCVDHALLRLLHARLVERDLTPAPHGAYRYRITDAGEAGPAVLQATPRASRPSSAETPYVGGLSRHVLAALVGTDGVRRQLTTAEIAAKIAPDFTTDSKAVGHALARLRDRGLTARNTLGDDGLPYRHRITDAGVLMLATTQTRQARQPATLRINRTVLRLLTCMRLDPDRAWRLNDLTSGTGLARNTVLASLSRLNAAGLVDSRGSYTTRTHALTTDGRRYPDPTSETPSGKGRRPPSPGQALRMTPQTRKVISVLSDGGRHTLTDVQARTGLPRDTIYSILTRLTGTGFAEVHPNPSAGPRQPRNHFQLTAAGRGLKPPGSPA